MLKFLEINDIINPEVKQVKIIYRQTSDSKVFNTSGILNCYLKELSMEKDLKSISKKGHYHTFFEAHIILSGHQEYEICGKKFKVTAGNLVVIPPRLKHLVTETDVSTHKISVTFGLSNDSIYGTFFKSMNDFLRSKLPKRIEDNIKYILEENKNRMMFHDALTQNRVFEIVVLLLRLCGFKEEDKAIEKSGEDVRLSMAKQYIKDNIELNPKLPDVASFCYIGTKQLTRLFKAFENTTPALYIQAKKFEHIEKLLSETDMSLKEISEKMNFSSEYHFNSFFKKIAGTPPGEYRTIMGK